ncbi:hypothetical protein K7X08_030937 [Anisodus acutangulus]|uniref:Uncharacterized protein n=1 Tax=Anisodus acutangulus TaxID=402998 RepID=A0A9Q1MUA0_9SOLA|nr:hypothetical protein K7X08_030937 [Anisodus acutangulus]
MCCGVVVVVVLRSGGEQSGGGGGVDDGFYEIVDNVLQMILYPRGVYVEFSSIKVSALANQQPILSNTSAH